MKHSEVGILIPSLSRPKILLKKLQYYQKLNVKFNIFICDSTPIPEKEFKKELNKISKNLKIKYFHKPALNDREALFHLIENCDTPYSAFIADDDFFIPEGLYKCASYLETHKDCRVAYGKSIIVDQISLNNPRSPIYASNYWGSKSFLEVNAEERLTKLSRYYLVNLFGVHRTIEFLEDFKGSSSCPSQSMGEVMVNYMTLSKGKGKFIPSAYLIRQSHSKRYLIPNELSDLLVEDKFGESIPIFLTSLTKALKDSNPSLKDANIISKRVLKLYLNQNVLFSQNSCKQKSLTSIFKKIYLRIFNSVKNKLFKHSKYFNGFLFYIKLISKTS